MVRASPGKGLGVGGRRVWSQTPASAKAMQVTYMKAACQQREKHKCLREKKRSCHGSHGGTGRDAWARGRTERVLLSEGRSSVAEKELVLCLFFFLII